MKTIKGSTDLSGIKRCYIGTQIKGKCPVCDNEVVFDFENDYVSHPGTGFMSEKGGYCDKCEDYVLMPYKISKVQATIECFPELSTMDK